MEAGEATSGAGETIRPCIILAVNMAALERRGTCVMQISDSEVSALKSVGFNCQARREAGKRHPAGPPWANREPLSLTSPITEVAPKTVLTFSRM